VSGQRTYPHGVPCWVDTEQPDLGAAEEFYRGLFGWTLTEAMPPGAPGSYLIATVEGADVAAIGPAPPGGTGPVEWQTYVAVQDADTTAQAVLEAGGRVVAAPADAGPGGRAATCTDPLGAGFRLWQPRRRLGAQRVNLPGSWNFSDLHTPDAETALRFYTAVFGWVAAPLGQGPGSMLQVPGYGDHLAATVDPGIRSRQASAPPGFADVIGGLIPTSPGEPAGWQVTFSVADRDDSVATAERLGATVLSSSDGDWTRTARIRDPQGAELTLSQFTPPH
jgi:predicted enzyme related to lactoylglutathione lyase